MAEKTYLMKVHHPYGHKNPSHINEFMDKLYRVTGYKKQYTFSDACRHSAAKKYITLSITDQETLEITFAVIIPLGDSLELYVDPVMENPP